MSKYKRNRISLEKRFKKELKVQQRLRLTQFIHSDKDGMAELLYRAKYATSILKVSKPFIKTKE